MKQCCRCKDIKPLDQFAKNKRHLDGLQKYCKACHKDSNARYFQENKEKFRSLNAAQRRDKAQKLQEYKQTLSCSSCGETKHWRLDFHHTNDDKDRAVSLMIKSHSWDNIIAEIKKCIVLCRNCHADAHYNEKLNATIF